MILGETIMHRLQHLLEQQGVGDGKEGYHIINQNI